MIRDYTTLALATLVFIGLNSLVERNEIMYENSMIYYPPADENTPSYALPYLSYPLPPPKNHFLNFWWWLETDNIPENVLPGYYYPEFHADPDALRALPRLCGHVSGGDIPVFIYNHVYKTGGSNLDSWLKLFSEWCDINLADYHAMTKLGGYDSFFDPFGQDEFDFISRADMVIGHMPHGLHALFPHKKVVYTTILRRPETTFVSGYFYRIQKSKTPPTFADMEAGRRAIEEEIDRKSEGLPYRCDFIFRLTSRMPTNVEHFEELTELSIRNLNEYQIVGLTEMWHLLIDSLQINMDPENLWPDWPSIKVVDFNNNGLFSSSGIVDILSDEYKVKLGEYVKYERRIYDHAVKMCHQQCMAFFQDSKKCAPILPLLEKRLPTLADVVPSPDV